MPAALGLLIAKTFVCAIDRSPLISEVPANEREGTQSAGRVESVQQVVERIGGFGDHWVQIAGRGLDGRMSEQLA